MKRTLFCAFLLLLNIGCDKDHKLTFERLQIKNTKCQGCPKIEINVPHAIDDTPIATSINTALREEIIYILKFEEDQDVDSIEKAMDSFTKNYQELQNRFIDETVAWEADIKASVTYEDERLLTLKLDVYSFTGGAHGYGSTIFLNFDKKKAIELENHQLFKDSDGFQKLAEAAFRQQEGIAKASSINSTGLMFSRDSFHLSENMGYTAEGLQLIYNQYEVASFADGPIVLTLPFRDIGQFLKFKIDS